MARELLVPRKQRTRQHVIADLSVHYVEGFILEAGHTAQQLERDYGYDLLVFTYDERGYVAPGFVSLQVKAAESLQRVGGVYVFDLDVRDYNLWMAEKMPVLLILFDAARRRAYWLAVKDYFRENAGRRPQKGAKTVRVRVATGQSLHRRGVARMRAMKNELHGKVSGAAS
jgi:hypothetical protein